MDGQETIADIAAEKRRTAKEVRDYASSGDYWDKKKANEAAEDLEQEADRLEAANKRERGDCAKLREAISNLRTALKEIRNDVLDMVMNYKSEDPDSYAHGLCLSIGGACDMALNSTKEFDNADK